MSLPFLVLLVAAIFSVALAGKTRLEVTFEARHAAWKRRHDPSPEGPLFLFGEPENALDREVPVPQLTTEQAARRVRLAPFLGRLGDREAVSKHAVLAGSWDYNELPFDEREPDVDRILKLAAAAPLNDIQGIRSAIESTRNALGGVLGQARKEAAEEARKVEEMERQLQQQQKQAEQERERIGQQRQQAEQQVARLESERRRLDQEKARLEEARQRAEAGEDPDRRQQQVAELDRQLATNRQQRESSNLELQRQRQNLRRLEALEEAHHGLLGK
jgi:hypothetical protein